MRALLFCLAVLLSFSASAQNAWNKYSDFLYSVTGPNKLSIMPTTSGTSQWVAAEMKATAAGAEFDRLVKMPLNGDLSGKLVGKGTFTPANIAKGITGTAVVSLIAAPLLSELITSACTRLAGGNMQLAPGAQWEECTFTTTAQTQYKHCANQFGTCGSWTTDKPSAFASDIALQATSLCNTGAATCINSCSCMQSISYPVTDINTGTFNMVLGACSYTCNGSNISVNSSTTARAGSYQTQTVNVQTQSGWTSATPAKAASDLQTLLTTRAAAASAAANVGTQGQFLPLVDELISKDGITIDPGPLTVSGPATGTPQVTTSTSTTNGTPVTTTTTVTPTYTYSYPTTNQTDVTINNTTTIVNPTTTTTTTTPNNQPIPDPCDANPDRAGCVKLGTPTPGTMPTANVPVSITPVVFGSTATCPPSVTVPFSILGHQFSSQFSWQPLCDASTMLAPLFMVLAAGMAAWVFVGGFKV